MGVLDFGTHVGIAAAIRRRCGFLDAEPPYSTHTIHRLVFPHVQLVRSRLPAGVLACTEAGVGAPVIYYNAGEPHPLQRVGIAHEFGHLLTDLRDARGFERRECVRNLRFEHLDEAELICEHIAGELLVPFAVLDRYAPARLFPTQPDRAEVFAMDIDRLSSRFNVPPHFIDWRLRDLAHLRRSSLARR